MELVPDLRWFILVVWVTVFYPNGGNASSFVDMSFHKTLTGGLYLHLYQAHRGVRSFLDCGVLCKMDTVADEERVCQGFGFDPMESVCDLYQKGSSPVFGPGVEIFLFKEKGVYQAISVNDRLYYVFIPEVEKSYFGARDYCHSVGGYLLEFDSLDEYPAVKMAANGRGWNYGFAYVGANDLAIEGTWVTDRDGLPLDTDTWIWLEGQPDSEPLHEDCALLYTFTPEIVNLACGDPRPFLCEKDV